MWNLNPKPLAQKANLVKLKQIKTGKDFVVTIFRHPAFITKSVDF